MAEQINSQAFGDFEISDEFQFSNYTIPFRIFILSLECTALLLLLTLICIAQNLRLLI